MTQCFINPAMLGVSQKPHRIAPSQCRAVAEYVRKEIVTNRLRSVVSKLLNAFLVANSIFVRITRSVYEIR